MGLCSFFYFKKLTNVDPGWITFLRSHRCGGIHYFRFCSTVIFRTSGWLATASYDDHCAILLIWSAWFVHSVLIWWRPHGAMLCYVQDKNQDQDYPLSTVQPGDNCTCLSVHPCICACCVVKKPPRTSRFCMDSGLIWRWWVSCRSCRGVLCCVVVVASDDAIIPGGSFQERRKMEK